MKKLLLLLIILPFLSFGQDDCGDKPLVNKFVNNKFVIIGHNSPEYKTYEEDLKIWKECQKINISSFENELINYFDGNNNDPIEGIWIFYLVDGTKFSKVGIKKSGKKDYFADYYIYLIKDYLQQNIYNTRAVTNSISQTSPTMFQVRGERNKINKWILKSNVLLESSGTDYTGRNQDGFGEKVYPK